MGVRPETLGAIMNSAGCAEVTMALVKFVVRRPFG